MSKFADTLFQRMCNAAPWDKAIESYAEAGEAVQAALDNHLETARVAFAAGARSLFNAHPELQFFGFSVRTGDSNITDIGGQGVEGETLEVAVAELLDQFNFEHVEDMFGVGIHVTTYRDGSVRVENCR